MRAARLKYAVIMSFWTLLCFTSFIAMRAQLPEPRKRVVNINEFEKSNGDAPKDPGRLANISGALNAEDIKVAMRKVADWEYGRIRNSPSQSWTFAPLYDGFLAASRVLGDPKYHDEVVSVGEHYRWTIGVGDISTNANEHALGYSYTQLYDENHDPTRIAALKSEFEGIKDMNANSGGKLIWWWCDALFMAPPTWSALSQVTDDSRYLDYMDRHYHETDALLWSTEYHLYFRDQRFLSKIETNGKPIFWSRGNGWVLAGLAMTLDNIPASDPRRHFYEQRFRQMAEEVLNIQGGDGLWRTGLLNPDAYPQPEVSGSAFFVYALSWGVNNNLLPKAVYKPAVRRAWKGLVSHIYADGRLGAIQPIGDSPGQYPAGASFNYGVGAFLLAGAETVKLAH